MNTPLVQAIIAKGGEEYTRYWKDGSPMGKLGQPEDLRGLVPKNPFPSLPCPSVFLSPVLGDIDG